jgi:hypothetical protein
MKGIYDKNAINNIVEPLTNIISVFEKDARIVYECEKENIYISIKNASENIFCICNIKAKDIIKEYTVVEQEIGIWDVNSLIRVLNLFQKDFYKDDLKIDVKDSCLVFKCGTDSSKFALSNLNIIEEQRARVREFNVDAFTECCAFSLNGDPLKKTISKFNVFSELDIINFSGKKDKALEMKLVDSSGALVTSSETIFSNVTCKHDFDMSFTKSNFKGILTASDSVEFVIYTGDTNIISAEYSNSGYDMQFYFSELMK